MIDRIYLCGDCLWPVSFPWGQKMHIGTGWYCWKEHHSDEEQVDAFWPVELPGDLEAMGEIVDEIVDLYDRWKARDKDRRVFTVARRYLRKGRTDVVHEFLKRSYRDENIGPFLKQLTSTEEWALLRRRRPRATSKKKDTARVEGPKRKASGTTTRSPKRRVRT